MIDQEDNSNLGEIVFDDNNEERKSWACLGQTCVQIFNCVFVPTFCAFVDSLRLLLESSPFKNL